MFKDNLLYIKISVTLLGLLTLLGLGYIFISTYTAQRYYQEVNQHMHRYLAAHLVSETNPIKNGKVDTAATHDIMHSMMVINRAVEVYLLDTTGYIIDYVVPFSKVKLDRVHLLPIKTFLQDTTLSYILGDDPKGEGKKKIFSAAPIHENERIMGYAYLILAGEAQENAFSTLFGSYMLNLGWYFFLITLLTALLIGLIAIWFLTKNLRGIIQTVQRFKEGDYQVRIANRDKGDLTILADTFNDMANQILVNIDKIKSVDTLRQELIANVSHDLRTPLAIMQGYIETLLLKEEQLSNKQKHQYLKIIFSSSERLGKLVSHLFEYSKLEANQITLEKEPFFITDLVQDVLMKYEILAQEKNIHLQLETEPSIPLVFADIALVERVIQNLLDNALKFTPMNGKIMMQLRTVDKGVEIKISDTGPGIPKDQQSHIFERYRRADVNSSHNKGTGLGLAIVKKILEIHNQTIQVHSQPQQGATFWFQLPVYYSA